MSRKDIEELRERVEKLERRWNNCPSCCDDDELRIEPPAPAPEEEREPGNEANEWRCIQCNSLQLATSERCSSCGQKRPEEPKDNSLPPCCDCPRDESSCEFDRLTCTAPEKVK